MDANAPAALQPTSRSSWDRDDRAAAASAAPRTRLAPGPAAPASLAWARVRRLTQLVVHVAHGQDPLGPTINAAIGRGLEVLADAALPDAGGTTWLLVVEQDWCGREVLSAAGLGYLVEPVVLVEAGPRASAVAQLGRCLAEANLTVQYSYAVARGADRLVAVFKTHDDEAALRLLQAGLGAGLRVVG
jgi:hypothetical protein